VHAALKIIQENPFRQPLYYGEFRRILTRRFPYKIFYAITRDRIVVFRVIHIKQDYRLLL
jgi:toxin ParE1/3/4